MPTPIRPINHNWNSEQGKSNFDSNQLINIVPLQGFLQNANAGKDAPGTLLRVDGSTTITNHQAKSLYTMWENSELIHDARNIESRVYKSSSVNKDDFNSLVKDGFVIGSSERMSFTSKANKVLRIFILSERNALTKKGESNPSFERILAEVKRPKRNSNLALASNTVIASMEKQALAQATKPDWLTEPDSDTPYYFNVRLDAIHRDGADYSVRIYEQTDYEGERYLTVWSCAGKYNSAGNKFFWGAIPLDSNNAWANAESTAMREVYRKMEGNYTEDHSLDPIKDAWGGEDMIGTRPDVESPTESNGSSRSSADPLLERLHEAIDPLLEKLHDLGYKYHVDPVEGFNSAPVFEIFEDVENNGVFVPEGIYNSVNGVENTLQKILEIKKRNKKSEKDVKSKKDSKKEKTPKKEKIMPEIPDSSIENDIESTPEGEFFGGGFETFQNATYITQKPTQLDNKKIADWQDKLKGVFDHRTGKETLSDMKQRRNFSQ